MPRTTSADGSGRSQGCAERGCADGDAGSAQGGARERFVVTEAERRVADLLPIEVDPVLARATAEAVPFWFHTFALNRAEGIYTPGAARDHRYRVCALPRTSPG